MHGRFNGWIAVAHAQDHLHATVRRRLLTRRTGIRSAQKAPELILQGMAQSARLQQKRTALGSPNGLIVGRCALGPIGQNAHIENGLPQRGRHVYKVSIGKELFQIRPDSLRRRLVGSARVHNQDA